MQGSAPRYSARSTGFVSSWTRGGYAKPTVTRRKRVPLLVELLEDRTVPTTVSVTNPGDTANLAGDAVSYHISASDSDDNPLAFTATGLPSGLSIDSSWGIISGTIANNAASSNAYSVTVTATDDIANVSGSQTFNWTVDPPVVHVSNPGDTTNLAGDSVNFPISAWDTDNYPLTFTADGLPSGLSIDSSWGIISGTLPNDARYCD